jgi:hypothetical protein
MNSFVKQLTLTPYRAVNAMHYGRNLSATTPAKVISFGVFEKGTGYDCGALIAALGTLRAGKGRILGCPSVMFVSSLRWEMRAWFHKLTPYCRCHEI